MVIKIIKTRKLYNTKINLFIKNYKEYLLTHEIFTNEEAIVYFFMNGGCYTFAKIIKKRFPRTKIMINNLKSHCVIGYNKDIYDIRGEIENLDFKIAKKRDIKYMELNFGINLIKNQEDYIFKEFEKYFIYQTLFGLKNNCDCSFNLSFDMFKN